MDTRTALAQVHEQGETIIEQGGRGSVLYFLIEGTIKCCTNMSGAQRMLYSIREEGGAQVRAVVDEEGCLAHAYT